MIRLRSFLSVAAAVAGVAFLASPSSVRADFKIYLQEDGGAITEVQSGPDFTALSFDGVYGDFAVTLLAGTSHNKPAKSDLLGSTLAVENTSGTAHTLAVYVSQTNYTLPTGAKLNVESGLGGSVITGTVGLAGIFQAYADKNNALLGNSFTTGSQTAIQSGTTLQTGSAFGVFNRDVTPFSLTTVTTLNLSGGALVNFADHENVTPAPAPAGLALALTALPCLGIGSWLRRRKAALQMMS